MSDRLLLHRASYRAGVAWISLNDNPGDDNPLTCGRDGAAQATMRASIAGYISTLLLADLFGAEPARVAADVFRHRATWMQAEAERGAR